MGSKSSKVDINTFDEEESLNINKLFDVYSINKSLEIIRFQKNIFFNLSIKPIELLNGIYSFRKLPNIKSISHDDFVYLAFLTTKINQTSDDSFNFYYRKSTFHILYDLITGKFGACEEKINIESIIEILSFAVDIFNSVQKEKYEFNRTNYSEIIKLNIENYTDKKVSITFNDIKELTDNIFYNLEAYLKQYFLHVFLKDFKNLQFTFALPIYTAKSSFLSIDQYFHFLLLNPHVYAKPNAFKLFDCSKSGFNIPDMIYSFLGFGGPIGIFIEHYEKSTQQKYVFGVFLNSNFKENYEAFCGDDLTFLFSINPKLEIYKYSGPNKKILFLCRRGQNFSKMIPGIGNYFLLYVGVGFIMEGHKLWLDANDLFKKSYFKKYDESFDSGTPFGDNIEHFLDVNDY